jgi:hypothetical protein
LPTWDTDHVVLAAIHGYHIQASSDAVAMLFRSVRTFGGRPKGMVDAAHRLPLWWAMFKALQYRDPSYLMEFVTRRMSSGSKRPNEANRSLKTLGIVYNRAAVQVLRNTLGGVSP